MFRLDIECGPDQAELLIAELWDAGCAGITEFDGGLRAFFEHSRGLAARFPGARLEPVEDRDWVAVSQAAWEPFCVGERFYLAPEWRDDPAPAGRVRIPVNPGLACGTGFHEATQLCLEALEAAPRLGIVLDVGTGSGILSVAAALCGAGRVIACDNDPVATAIAQANFAKAGVSPLLFTGSLDALRPPAADTVVCNISAPAAVAMVPGIFQLLREGGRGMLAGFEAPEATAVQQALNACGAIMEDLRERNGWTLLVARKP